LHLHTSKEKYTSTEKAGFVELDQELELKLK